MASNGTRLAGLGVFARNTVSLQRGVEAECELKHCVDEEGRGQRPRVTGRRKVGVCQGGCKAAGPLLSITSCPPTARNRGACCRLRTDPFWDGMTMSRKQLLAEDAGMEKMRRGWCGCGSSCFQRLRTVITQSTARQAFSRAPKSLSHVKLWKWMEELVVSVESMENEALLST
jgi:hypothetical protein